MCINWVYSLLYLLNLGLRIHGLCSDFPDWTIAAAGSEKFVRIGFEYARFVTKEEQQIEPHLLEPDDVHSDLPKSGADHELSLVATSAEVLSIACVCMHV